MQQVTGLRRLLLCILCSLLSACASQLQTTQSGYLLDYSRLKESPQFENTKIYISPNFDKDFLAKSRKIAVEPFEIWINQADNTPFNTIQIAELSRYFHRQLVSKLRSTHKVMISADNETLIIRGAFSGLKLKSPDLSVSDFIPIRLVFNATNAAYLIATDQEDIISEVSLEAEFVIGARAERVFAMTASKQIDTTVSSDGTDNMRAVRQVLDIWVSNFVTALSKI